MRDAVSEAPSAEGSSGADPALEAFGLDVDAAPPLSWLAALAALCAMTINQLLVPGLGRGPQRVLAQELSRYGAFATNLAAIAGLIAIGFGLHAFLRYSPVINLRRRLLLGTFAVIFLPTVAVATLFERQRTTAQAVLFALGAAHVLGANVSLCAVQAATRRYARGLGVLAAAMALLALLAQVVELLQQVGLRAWHAQAHSALSGMGELCYLALLCGMTPLLLPARGDTRGRVARLAGFFVLPIVLGGLYAAERMLESDYALLLYHSQHVTLFIDSWPRIYAIPIALALAGSFAAVLGSPDPARSQAAAGVLLLIGSGYSPAAPGRLLTFALALVLIARALIGPARSELRDR
jgi:hypothetical protein